MTAQRLLSRRDRALGNSILQSGASLGAIATPIVVLLLAGTAPESWRTPFRVIGALGIFWVVGWLSTILRGRPRGEAVRARRRRPPTTTGLGRRPRLATDPRSSAGSWRWRSS